MPYADTKKAREYHKAYMRGWHARQTPEQLERKKAVAKTSRQRLAAELRALVNEKKSQPCVDCGITLPPEVMDLDHVRGVKAFTISTAIQRGFKVARVAEELEKCDVRCPICHRMRHYCEDDPRVAAGSRR